MLDKMLTLQEGFQNYLGNDIGNMDISEKVAYIKEHTIHLTQEIHEMLYELPYFKPWKDYSNMTTAEKSIQIGRAREEFIDVWHFILNIAIALDLDAETITDLYLKKNDENITRQEVGYTHDKQYR